LKKNVSKFFLITLKLAAIMLMRSFEASAQCTSPAGVGGQLRFASPDYVYCDGTTWKSMTVSVSGDACTKAGELGRDGTNLRFCNGTNWVSANGAATGDSCVGSREGAINWFGTSNYLRWCIDTNWRHVGNYTQPSSPTGPTGCDTIGQACDDGSFYVGLSPADGKKVFMTSSTFQASSIRFDSATCTRCGDGTVATSITDGRANTKALLAFNASGFNAAKYCDDLSAHGHTDWYLPSGGGVTSEQQLMHQMNLSAGGSVGGLGGLVVYFSSTEASSNNAHFFNYNTGATGSGGKDFSRNVRCIRRL
jgi:hypothetical protein